MQKELIETIDNNLKDRDLERNISQFKNHSHYTINFIKLSSENGVIRNGGRRGAAFAPMAILNVFKKQALRYPEHTFTECELADAHLEITDFDLAQKEEAQKIKANLEKTKADTHIFIGGGHDHAFPILTALESLHPGKKIKIVNIDPHLDMRVDTLKNSGTPFRQFDQSTKVKHQLIQIGCLNYTNVKSSHQNTQTIEQKIIFAKDVYEQTENYTKNKMFFDRYFPSSESSDWIYFLSIDIDAIESSSMEAVSAVNPEGLSLEFVRDLVGYFKHHLKTTYIGFFEYNPIYDNLSQKGARSLTSVIERIL